MSGHERERLSAYLDGELAPGERAAVEAHLAACPECAAVLARLAAVDEAAAGLPVEAPEGYFETFPARVRARLQPRKAASPARRLPVWTWAAAAGLLLAVITPLTLRQTRPAPGETPPSVSVKEQPVPTEGEPNVAVRSRPPEPRPKASSPRASQRGPVPPAALPSGVVRSPALVPPAGVVGAPAVVDAAPPESKEEGAAGELFAREPAAPPPPEQALARPEAQADLEAERAVGGVAAQDAARPEKRARAAARPAGTAEAVSPTLAAASAGTGAAPAGVEEHADAFRRLEGERPRSAAGWRRLREQWNALASAEPDPVRADEARVRAIVAAWEAWRAGGDESDEAAFRGEAESYLRRADARQKPRVEALLAGR